MKLKQSHIRTYLKNHGQLCFPEIGALMLKRKQADVHPVTHSFSPPVSYYHFNSFLAKKDRDFIEWLGENGFEEPNSVYEKFTEGLKKQLKENGKFTFKQIGQLKEKSGKLKFQANKKDIEDDDLNDSFFGLPEFTSAVVYPADAADSDKSAHETDSAAEPTKGSLKKTVAPLNAESGQSDEDQPRIRKVKWAWAAAILLLLSATFLFIVLDISIKPLQADSDKVNSLLKRWFPTEVSIELEPILSEDFERFEAQPITSLKSVNTSTESVAAIDKDPATNSVPSSTVNPPKSGFYLILGSFQDKGNAEILKSNLLGEGVDARIFHAEKKGFYRTGYYIGDDEKEALEILEIAKKESPGVWILSQ